MPGVSHILRLYTGGGKPQPDAEEHFGQVANAVPKSSLADGLAEAFRSDETPSFGQMVSHLFTNHRASKRRAF